MRKAIALERFIKAGEKNPNTDRNIIGLEDQIQKALWDDKLKYVYYVSNIDDILPRLSNPPFTPLDEKDIIGEIIDIDEESVIIALNEDGPKMAQSKLASSKVLFTYDCDRTTDDLVVTEIFAAYVMKEKPIKYVKSPDESIGFITRIKTIASIIKG